MFKKIIKETTLALCKCSIIVNKYFSTPWIRSAIINVCYSIRYYLFESSSILYIPVHCGLVLNSPDRFQIVYILTPLDFSLISNNFKTLIRSWFFLVACKKFSCPISLFILSILSVFGFNFILLFCSGL